MSPWWPQTPRHPSSIPSATATLTLIKAAPCGPYLYHSLILINKSSENRDIRKLVSLRRLLILWTQSYEPLLDNTVPQKMLAIYGHSRGN